MSNAVQPETRELDRRTATSLQRNDRTRSQISSPELFPAFQQTHPTLPEPDPGQASLFSPGGAPMRDWLDAQVVLDRVDALLSAMRVPGSHRRGYAAHLCDGAWIDPGLLVWLGAPGRTRRWRGLVEAFEFT